MWSWISDLTPDDAQKNQNIVHTSLPKCYHWIGSNLFQEYLEWMNYTLEKDFRKILISSRYFILVTLHQLSFITKFNHDNSAGSRNAKVLWVRFIKKKCND